MENKLLKKEAENIPESDTLKEGLVNALNKCIGGTEYYLRSKEKLHDEQFKMVVEANIKYLEETKVDKVEGIIEILCQSIESAEKKSVCDVSVRKEIFINALADAKDKMEELLYDMAKDVEFAFKDYSAHHEMVRKGSFTGIEAFG
jgi:hypothetical protein